MLGKQGIVSGEEVEAICVGLEAIQAEIESGVFPFREELEDIHMNVETRLLELIGEAAGRLHTARSRNDQVALDVRMFVRDSIDEIVSGLRGFQASLLLQAEANVDTIIPGYTHLQRAQPVLVAHHLLAYFEMAQRDVERFGDCRRRVNVLPLGAGALAGVTYDIDREFVARELGFDGVGRNSMDAVSDRDFLVEFHAAASIAMMHMSRLAEELIIWTSEEFGFAKLAPEYTTGSSIMPQKRNPDVAELARGKVGRVYGNLMGMLTMLKGLPLSYNKDMQEDKEGLFDTVVTLNTTLDAFAGMVETMTVNRERTRRAAEDGVYSGILATDLADYLVTKGVPFREAHGATKALVAYAGEKGLGLDKLKLEEYQQFSALFDEDAFEITVESSLGARGSQGGTAPERVREALAGARQLLETGNG